MTTSKKLTDIITYIAIILFSLGFIFFGHRITSSGQDHEVAGDIYKAKVLSIESIETEEFSFDDISYAENKIIRFRAEITSGPSKGEIVEVVQNLSSMYAIQPVEIQEGHKVLISYMGDEVYGDQWGFVEFNRSDTLAWLAVIFLLLILLLGRSKGISTIISLIFTVLAIFLVFVPSILKGYNIYLSSTIVTIYIIFMSLLIINGPSKKTLCAIIGNIGGVAIAALVAIIMSKILNLTGFIDEDYVFLNYLELDKPIDLVAIIWSGILIGSLGAVMDVAMSIASAMNELAENMDKKTFSRLLRSGMNIGRDAIGTMTNTLILAYVGGSLATVLLLIAYNRNLLYLFSLEMIVVEVLQAIVGSMGILFAVPVTAIFSAYIFTRDTRESGLE